MNLNQLETSTICLGSHPGIIQSMLDYAFCIGQEKPNILAIVSAGRKQERYFWGHDEIVIKLFPSISSIPQNLRTQARCLLNVKSARRALSEMKEAFEQLPNLNVANIFAEQVPEAHALEISRLAHERGITVLGPSSVGLLVPGRIKLGAIGGTQYQQLVAAKIFEPGDIAVISTSGGMVNELIHTATHSGNGVSFAVALGGDRFPITNPSEAFLMAEADQNTQRILYFGELGGVDEYEIAELMKAGKVTKDVIAYIAGSVAELFPDPPQFGHAKAMAATADESASAKKAILKQAGATVIDVFADLPEILSKTGGNMSEQAHKKIEHRKKSLIISHISGDVDGDVKLLGDDLLDLARENGFAAVALSMFLGQKVDSQKLVDFTDQILRLLVDHGPYVSGAVNTIVSARAGKDLVSSLATGLLTIGPRFGGAINASAGVWLDGVGSGDDAKSFVNSFTATGGIIPGIGHKKYRIDLPDPRVKFLTDKYADNSNGDRYLNFARGVEQVTTGKKGNLILNVDGAIGAMLLDLIESELGYSPEQLHELVDIEFFNAIFVLARSVGFMSHYFDQRRHDEGLLRLGPDEIKYISSE